MTDTLIALFEYDSTDPFVLRPPPHVYMAHDPRAVSEEDVEMFKKILTRLFRSSPRWKCSVRIGIAERAGFSGYAICPRAICKFIPQLKEHGWGAHRFSRVATGLDLPRYWYTKRGPCHCSSVFFISNKQILDWGLQCPLAPAIGQMA